jgi:hypothetical protein
LPAAARHALRRLSLLLHQAKLPSLVLLLALLLLVLALALLSAPCCVSLPAQA